MLQQQSRILHPPQPHSNPAKPKQLFISLDSACNIDIYSFKFLVNGRYSQLSCLPQQWPEHRSQSRHRRRSSRCASAIFGLLFWVIKLRRLYARGQIVEKTPDVAPPPQTQHHLPKEAQSEPIHEVYGTPGPRSDAHLTNSVDMEQPGA